MNVLCSECARMEYCTARNPWNCNTLEAASNSQLLKSTFCFGASRRSLQENSTPEMLTEHDVFTKFKLEEWRSNVRTSLYLLSKAYLTGNSNWSSTKLRYIGSKDFLLNWRGEIPPTVEDVWKFKNDEKINEKSKWYGGENNQGYLKNKKIVLFHPTPSWKINTDPTGWKLTKPSNKEGI